MISYTRLKFKICFIWTSLFKYEMLLNNKYENETKYKF